MKGENKAFGSQDLLKTTKGTSKGAVINNLRCFHSQSCSLSTRCHCLSCRPTEKSFCIYRDYEDSFKHLSS